MKIFLFHLIYLFFVFNVSYAQKEANVWIWGDEVGINFNYNLFTPLHVSGFRQMGGSASIADPKTGELLFYTDGRKVWNASHGFMPNGTGLYGGYTTTQPALIVPSPGKEEIYYLFTTKSYSDSLADFGDDTKATGLYYSLVDMRLDGGKGDIVKENKNILLLEKSTEKLTAIPHSNGKDYGIMTHEWGSDLFVVYLLSESGISEPNFISIGKLYTPENSKGKLMPSPNSKMIACAVYGEREIGSLELYDFDASSGTIYNLRKLGTYYLIQHCCFSPDNSKLYFSYGIANPFPFDDERSVQLNLKLKDTQLILESRTEISYSSLTGSGEPDTLRGGDFQTAPDGRMYSTITKLYYDNENFKIRRRIYFLEKPNNAGEACEPKSRDFDVGVLADGVMVSEATFPNFMQHYFNNLEPVNNFHDEKECKELYLRVYPNPTNGIVKISMSNQNGINCVYPLEIKAFDVLGRKLMQQKLSSEESNQVTLKNYASGMYYITIENQFKKSVFKVIKNNDLN